MNRFRKMLMLAAGIGLATSSAWAQVPVFRTLTGSGSRLDTVGILAQLNNPSSVAMSADSQYIYWTDQDRHTLRRVHVRTRRTETVAGIGYNINQVQNGVSTRSALNNPTSVALSGDSLAYVTNFGIQSGNFGNAAMARVNLNTGITSVIPLGTLERRQQEGIFVLPGDVADTVFFGAAYQSNGGFQMAIINKNAPVLISGSLVIPYVSANPAGIGDVGAVTLVGDSIWVGDTRGIIFKVGRDGVGYRRFLTGLGSISSLWKLNDTTVLVTNSATGNLTSINTRTGAITSLGAFLSNPQGVVANDTALFYVEGSTSNRIRYALRSQPGTAFPFVGRNTFPVNGDSLISSFGQTWDVAIGASNVLYVADRGAGQIRAVDRTTGATRLIRNTPSIWDVVYRDSVLYYTENSRNAVFRISSFNMRTGRVQFLAGAAGLSGPAGTQVDGDSANSRLKYPQGLVIDKSGRNLYFGSAGGNEGGAALRRVNLATKVTTTIAGSMVPATGYVDAVGTNARFGDVADLAIFGDTVIYIVDSGNDRIRRIDLRSFEVTTAAGSGVDVRSNPRDNVNNGLQATIANARTIVADTINRMVYFTDGNNIRRMVAGGTHGIRTIAGNESSGLVNGLGLNTRFFVPRGMAMDSGARQLFLADGDNYNVRAARFIINTAPTFTNGVNVRAFENAPLQVLPGFITNILGGSTPEEAAQEVRFFLTNDNPVLFQIQPRIDSLGRLFFLPALNRFGTATISYIGRDNGGTDLGGVDSSARFTFTITIDSVNSAPVFTVTTGNRTITTTTGVGTVTVNNWATAIAASGAPNFEQWQSMNFEFRTKRPEFYSVAPRVNITGTNGVLTFSPGRTVSGRDTLTVILRDNGGVANGGVDSATINLVVVLNPYTNVRPNFTISTANAALNYPAIVVGNTTTINNWLTGLSAGPTGESWQTLDITVRTQNPAMYAVLPTAVIVQSGNNRNANMSFTLSGVPGQDSLYIVLKDNGGNAFGGVDSIVRKGTLTVAVNQAPTFTVSTANSTLSYPMNATNTVNITSWATAVTPGPTLENPQTLSFSVRSRNNTALFATAPAVAVVGTTTRTGTLSFVLAGVNGIDTLDVMLKDNGGTFGGGVDSLVRTLIVRVGQTGLSERLEATAARVYPNPATDLINIDLSGMSSAAPVTAVLRSATGQDVWAGSLQAQEHNQLSLSEMPAGIYTLHLTQDGKHLIQKISKR